MRCPDIRKMHKVDKYQLFVTLLWLECDNNWNAAQRRWATEWGKWRRTLQAGDPAVTADRVRSEAVTALTAKLETERAAGKQQRC